MADYRSNREVVDGPTAMAEIREAHQDEGQRARVSTRDQLTLSAQRDVDRITDFIAEDNVEAALRVHDAREEAFRHLAEMPAIGHTREDLTGQPVKFWSVYSYLVVYDPASPLSR